jgi:hypothetical protein
LEISEQLFAKAEAAAKRASAMARGMELFSPIFITAVI